MLFGKSTLVISVCQVWLLIQGTIACWDHHSGVEKAIHQTIHHPLFYHQAPNTHPTGH